MKWKISIMILMMMLLASSQAQSQTLEICISNIKTSEGQLCVGIFNSEKGFKEEKTYWEKYFPKTILTEKAFKFKIQLPAGTYGISILDDINMDGKMKYNVIGIPLEGFGFGNYRHKSIFKPHFSDFSFEIKENETFHVQIDMQYF